MKIIPKNSLLPQSSLKKIMQPSLLLYWPLLLIIFSNTPAVATAVVCPVCTIMIASGLGIAKFLGVQDSVVGVWFGAILFILRQQCFNLLRKKTKKELLCHILATLSVILLLLPLYLGKKPPLVINIKTIFGLDSFLLAVTGGACMLWSSLKLYGYIKNKNGKPHFPFEKVVLPILGLIILSLLVNYW